MSIDKESAACIATLRRLAEQGLLTEEELALLLPKVTGVSVLRCIIKTGENDLVILSRHLKELLRQKW